MRIDSERGRGGGGGGDEAEEYRPVAIARCTNTTQVLILDFVALQWEAVRGAK